MQQELFHAKYHSLNQVAVLGSNALPGEGMGRVW
jgi:hypothetical protein